MFMIAATVNLLDQYTLTQLSGGGAPFRTALRHAIHLAHTARCFKCTLVYHRFFPLRAYWSIRFTVDQNLLSLTP